MTEDIAQPDSIIDQTQRYEVREYLGKSLHGESFHCIDQEQDGLDCVLKLSTNYPTSDSTQLKRQIEALIRLQHTNLANYFDYGIIEHQLFLARHYVDGLNLRNYLLQPPSPQECDEFHLAPVQPSLFDDTGDVDFRPELDLILRRLDKILPQILAGLEHLHRFRKSHGHLTADNIIVDLNGVCFLTDYGLAYDLIPAAKAQSSSNNERPDQTISTTHEAYDSSNDLHALGRILFEAISSVPYPTDEVAASGETSATSLAELEPRCPATWLEIVHVLLDRSPSKQPTIDLISTLHAQSEAKAINIPPSVVEHRPLYFDRQLLLDSLTDRAKEHIHQKRFLLTLLDGPIGIGKTVLVDALSSWAATHGWFVLRGRCYQREPIIYQGWDQIIEQLGQICTQVDSAEPEQWLQLRQKAAQLFPNLSPYYDDSGSHTTVFHGATPIVSRIRREQAINALRQILQTISNQRPILICLDDAHWSSWDTAELLIDLLAKPLAGRCVFVAAVDSEEASWKNHPLKKDLYLCPINVEHVGMSKFSAKEASNFVEQAGAHLSKNKQLSILENSADHPLLLGELLYHEDDLSVPNSDQLTTRSKPANVDTLHRQNKYQSDPKQIQHRLLDVISARVTQLNRAERLILQLLAVSSGPLSMDSLTFIVNSELGSSHLVEHSSQHLLDRLLELRLVQKIHTPAINQQQSHNIYTVKHHYCREYIVQTLGHDHHSHLCSLIAESIQGQNPNAQILRYEYLLRAERTQDAAKAARNAALYAEQRFAFNRAAKLWRWLIYESQTLKKSDDRLHCHERLAITESLAGRYLEAATLYNHIATTYPDIDTEKQAFLSFHEAAAWLQCGDTAQARQAYNRAIKANHTRMPLPTWLNPRSRVLRAFMIRRLQAARIKNREHRSAMPLNAKLYWSLFENHVYLSSHRSHFYHTRLLKLATLTHAPLVSGVALLGSPNEYRYPICSTNKQWLDALYTKAQSFLSYAGPLGLFLYHTASARICIYHGRLDEAESHLDIAYPLQFQIDDLLATHEYLVLDLQAQLAFAKGEFAQATTINKAILHTYRNNRLAEIPARIRLANIALIEGNLAETEKSIHEILSTIEISNDSFLQIEFIQLSTRWNLARSRSDVAVAQLDAVIDEMYTNGLARVPAALHCAYLCLGQSLASFANRQLHFQEDRATQTLKRLRQTIKQLRSISTTLTPAAYFEVERLRVHYFLLIQRPKKALRILDRAIRIYASSADPVVQAKCSEIRGYILARMEKPESKVCAEQAAQLYAHLGVYLPLVLEGWPPPRSQTMLKEGQPNEESVHVAIPEYY